MSQIWGIPMTGKSFSYILGLQVSVGLNNILFTVNLTFYDIYIQSNLGYPNGDCPKLLGYSKMMDGPEFFLYYLLQ